MLTMKRWVRPVLVAVCLALWPWIVGTGGPTRAWPPAVGLREVWNADLNLGELNGLYADHGYIVSSVRDGRGLIISRMATGSRISEVLPHGIPQEYGAEQLRINGSTLVIAWTAVGSDPVLLRGYDVATGRQVWHRDVAQPSGLGPRVALTGRIAAVFSGFPVKVKAFDVYTGAQRWSAEPTIAGLRFQSLEYSAVYADAGKIWYVFMWHRSPGSLAKLTALDSLTGRRLWQQAIRMPVEPSAYDAIGYPYQLRLTPSDAGDIAVKVGEELRMYSDSGRLLSRGSDYVWSLTRKGSVLYVQERDPQEKEYKPFRLRALDVNRGETLWDRPVYASLELEGNAMIGQIRHEWPMATYVEYLALDSGHSVQVPVLSSVWHTELIGSHGDLLAIWEEKGNTVTPPDGLFGRLTVYRLVADPGNPHPALAGLPPARWPDACRLLHFGKLSTSVQYTPIPQRRSIFGTRLPQPSACTYVPDKGTAPLIRLSVEYTAPSAREAERLMRSRLALARLSFQTAEWIGSRRIAVTEEPPSGQIYAVYVRVGTSVVRITTTPTTPALVRRAAEAVELSGSHD
ncbi:hypothetical protein GCM10027072_75760 [Streptomyces bullii]